MKGKSRAVLMAGLGTVLSMSVAASSSAAVSSLAVGSGTLAARGLEASVPVTFVCGDGELYNLNLTVEQVVQQKTITAGFSGTSGTCTGETQAVSVQLRPGPKPFKKGNALADAYVETYCYIPEFDSYDFCGSTAVTKVIQLR